jgi:hypothetical protein
VTKSHELPFVLGEMKTTPDRPDLAGNNSKRIGGARRSTTRHSVGRMIVNAGWLSRLVVALALVVACVPLDVRAQPTGGGFSPRRGWLGLAGEDLGYGAQGVMVVEVAPGSPAAAAGLRVGDHLVTVNDRPIRSHLELGRWMAGFSPGTVLRFMVRRGHRLTEIAARLGEPPTPVGPAARSTGTRAWPAAPAPAPSRSSSEWSCRAVGTYAPASSGGPDYSDLQNIDVTKWGATRDAAGFAAIDNCSDRLHLQTSSVLSPGALVIEACRVIRCSR